MGSIDYNALISKPLKNIEDGLDNVGHFDVRIGAVEPNHLTYPVAHIIPDQTRYEEGDEFRAYYDVYFYYEKDMDRAEAFFDMIEETTDSIQKVFDELETNKYAFEYDIVEINHNAREYNNSLLDVVNYRFRVKLGRY